MTNLGILLNNNTLGVLTLIIIEEFKSTTEEERREAVTNIVIKIINRNVKNQKYQVIDYID